MVVLVDSLDLATTRALRLARSIGLDSEVRVVHFMVDQARADALRGSWVELGVERFPLEVIECPDRRIARAASELGQDLAADGETQVIFVLPRRMDHGLVNRVLHDRTAERIVDAVSRIPNVSAAVVPLDVQASVERKATREQLAAAAAGDPAPRSAETKGGQPTTRKEKVHLPGTVPIGNVQHRQRAIVGGRVRTVQVQPWAGVPTFECTVVDATGALTIVFLGRRSVAGIKPGGYLRAEGTIGVHRDRLAMLNPMYELVASEEARGTATG